MGRIVYRVGTKALPRLRGARRECDPGVLPADRFRDIINGRFVGPELASRGGQEKVTSGGALSGGCVTGIFPSEYQDDEIAFTGFDQASVVWDSNLYLGSQAIGTGPDPGPYSWNVRRIAPFGTSPSLFLSAASAFGGSNGLALPRRHFYDAYRTPTVQPYDGPVINVATLTAAGGSGGYILALLGFDGSLYAAVYDGTSAYGVQGVYRISGSAFVSEDVPGSGPNFPQYLIEYGGDLYAIFASDGVSTPTPSGVPGWPIIRRRNGAGSWSTVATFAGSATITHFVTGVAVYDGLLWLAVGRIDWTAGVQTGAQVELWTFDGAALSLVRTVVAEVATPPTVGPGRLQVFNDLLYYAWRNISGTAQRLGTYNLAGAVFTDTHKDFTGIAGQDDAMESTLRMAEYDGNLVVISGASPANVVVSPGTNTAGTWVATAAADDVFAEVLDTI